MIQGIFKNERNEWDLTVASMEKSTDCYKEKLKKLI